MLWLVIICVICTPLTSGVQSETVEANSKPGEPSEADRRHNELCAGILSRVTLISEIPLDLDGTKEVYEVALDHLTKATSYITSMRPYLNEERVEKFDSKAGELVRAISEGRVKLLENYSSAAKSNGVEDERQKILARHLYDACKLRIPAVMSEKMMLDLVQRLEANLHVKLLNQAAK